MKYTHPCGCNPASLPSLPILMVWYLQRKHPLQSQNLPATLDRYGLDHSTKTCVWIPWEWQWFRGNDVGGFCFLSGGCSDRIRKWKLHQSLCSCCTLQKAGRDLLWLSCYAAVGWELLHLLYIFWNQVSAGIASCLFWKESGRNWGGMLVPMDYHQKLCR